MRKAMRWAMAGVVLAGTVLLPDESAAQRTRRGEFPDARFTVEVFGGVADYGRFLEQYAMVGEFLGERELRASTALALGLSVGAFAWEKTGVRLGFTWSPSELEFKDDTGIDVEVLDEDNLADLSAYVLSLDLMRFLFDPSRRFTPFASAGITATWWSLGDDDSGELISTDDTHFRWGGMGSIGAQYRVNRKFGVRGEIATMGLGNPFDGKNSFRTATGLTFDEPSSVRLTRITLALTYSFLKH